jgi:hypothetical protein
MPATYLAPLTYLLSSLHLCYNAILFVQIASIREILKFRFMIPLLQISLRHFIFRYNQKDATLRNSFISARRSTCFRRFHRPSSGAQKLYIQHRVFVKPLLLLFATVVELGLPAGSPSSTTIASGICQAVTTTFRYRGGAGNGSQLHHDNERQK